METRRWINHSLPQTLGNAVLLLYISAAFDALLGGYLFSPIGILIVAGKAAAGYGIANEKKWGYQLGLVMAFSPFVLRFLIGGLDDVLGTNLISLLFEIVLVALLLHKDSKEYQRIWFS
ncbi:MAG TPA: hypothetical protein VFU14_14240 [Acidimicrobiales bacterium]|nr:hypothetical protein [Acidimicrobiales bacterium]